LIETGWQVRLAAGSLGGPDASTNAASFFSGIDVSPVDYSVALRGADTLAAAFLYSAENRRRSGRSTSSGSDAARPPPDSLRSPSARSANRAATPSLFSISNIVSPTPISPSRTH
jgi:hypothetical protein